MSFSRYIFCFFVLVATLPSFSFDRVTGANASLNIVPGARSAALGGTVMAQKEELIGITDNPWQLALQEYAWGSFSHVAYFEGTVYDMASMTIPLEGMHGLGVSFSRFGANDIPWIKEGEQIPEGSDYKTLNIADWTFSIAYGRRLWKNLDLGIAVHGLYRELDQTGWGFRSDVGLSYTFPKNFSVAAVLKGWTSSAAKWESGTFEYESPELYLAASWNYLIRYFYGSFGAYWQSAGVFHNEARDLDFEGNERGGDIFESPLDWLSGGRGGIEFAFDFRLSLRAGLSSFTTFESFTVGAGVVVSKFLKVDYAFESHPVLSSVHRVSVSISPWLFFNEPKEKKLKQEKSFVEKEEPVEISEQQETIEENQIVEKEPEEFNEEPVAVEETESEVLEGSGGIYWEE